MQTNNNMVENHIRRVQMPDVWTTIHNRYRKEIYERRFQYTTLQNRGVFANSGTAMSSLFMLDYNLSLDTLTNIYGLNKGVVINNNFGLLHSIGVRPIWHSNLYGVENQPLLYRVRLPLPNEPQHELACVPTDFCMVNRVGMKLTQGYYATTGSETMQEDKDIMTPRQDYYRDIMPPIQTYYASFEVELIQFYEGQYYRVFATSPLFITASPIIAEPRKKTNDPPRQQYGREYIIGSSGNQDFIRYILSIPPTDWTRQPDCYHLLVTYNSMMLQNATRIYEYTGTSIIMNALISIYLNVAGKMQLIGRMDGRTSHNPVIRF